MQQPPQLRSRPTAVKSRTTCPTSTTTAPEFNILCRTEWAYEFDVEEQTGDLVSDAIYERNSKVEERFNVDLVYSEVDGSWGAQNTFLTR